jgi:tRNA (guanine26-N2/guanine27-N2)-dimethyltransferase
VHAVDHNEDAITIGSEIAKEIGCDIQFHRASLCTHLYENRYSYIDIDPYGSPLPFVTAALSSILPGGVIAVTATDTAALCGSNTRVAMRRYAAQLEKTEYMKEISCRVLACYLARTAASMELSIEPLLFIASDHYVRGFIRVRKGAKKADETVKLIGQVIYGPPERPMPPEMGVIGRILGPMWLGRLEDVDTVHALSRDLMIDGGISEHMSSVRSLSRIAETATGESDLPPFGFDTDAVASYLSASPPPMDDLVMHLIDRGFPSARSRFGGKIVRTSALFSDIAPLFREV